MAKGSEAAKKAAGEPHDLYDELSPESQGIWDQIGALGYTPEKGAAGLWFARQPGQDAKDAVGPAEHIESLLSQVKDAVSKGEPPSDRIIDSEDLESDAVLEEEEIDVENPEMVELKDDGEGNPYLPGAAPEVIKVLAAAIVDYDRVKLERVELSNQEKTAKKTMGFLLKKFEKYLEVDPDTDDKYYAVGKVRGVIKREVEEVFGSDHKVIED